MQDLHVPHHSKGSSDGQQRARSTFAKGPRGFSKIHNQAGQLVSFTKIKRFKKAVKIKRSVRAAVGPNERFRISREF
jgi:hypothetical protein